MSVANLVPLRSGSKAPLKLKDRGLRPLKGEGQNSERSKACIVGSPHDWSGPQSGAVRTVFQFRGRTKTPKDFREEREERCGREKNPNSRGKAWIGWS